MKCFRTVYMFLLLLTCLLSFSCATGDGVPRSAGELSAEQLKGLLDRGEDLTVVDTRSEYEYRKGRIPGSINIASHLFPQLGGLLPADKSARLVFYCRGTG